VFQVTRSGVAVAVVDHPAFQCRVQVIRQAFCARSCHLCCQCFVHKGITGGPTLACYVDKVKLSIANTRYVLVFSALHIAVCGCFRLHWL